MGPLILYCFIVRKISVIYYTFVDVEKGADAVACAVQVIQSDLVEMLTGDYVDTGVVDSFREDETGQVDGSHKNSGVNVFFTSTGPAEMDSPRHIRRPVCYYNYFNL